MLLYRVLMGKFKAAIFRSDVYARRAGKTKPMANPQMPEIRVMRPRSVMKYAMITGGIAARRRKQVRVVRESTSARCTSSP